jgi:hypothetical protein
MLKALILTSAIIFLPMGGLLLYGPVLSRDANQTAQLLCGATLVTLSLLTTLLMVRDWLDGKKHCKNAGRRDHG